MSRRRRRQQLLQNREIVAAFRLEADCQCQPGEACADDEDGNVLVVSCHGCVSPYLPRMFRFLIRIILRTRKSNAAKPAEPRRVLLRKRSIYIPGK